MWLPLVVDGAYLVDALTDGGEDLEWAIMVPRRGRMDDHRRRHREERRPCRNASIFRQMHAVRPTFALQLAQLDLL